MRRSLLVSSVVALVVVAGSGVAGATTVTSNSSQTIDIGTIVSGTRYQLSYIDGVKETLQEADDAPGTTKLQVKWTFDSVPAGTHKLHYWGTRPSNPDGDNFQFYYNTNGGSFGLLIEGALINKNFAPTNGVYFDLPATTDPSTNYTVFLSDTVAPYIHQATVVLDAVTIETEP